MPSSLPLWPAGAKDLFPGMKATGLNTKVGGVKSCPLPPAAQGRCSARVRPGQSSDLAPTRRSHRSRRHLRSEAARRAPRFQVRERRQGKAPGSGLAFYLPPPAVVTRVWGYSITTTPVAGSSKARCKLSAAARSAVSTASLLTDIAQCKMDEPGAISACGHKTLKVVVLGTDHEIVLSRVRADLRVGRPLQPQQRQLAGARKPSL